MRCKGCDYPLWNLTARLCPECGRPFAPSEFEFVRNSVRFCCPHCQQDYYGTGARGHLVPPAFNCVRCAAPIAMDQMVLLPTEGVTEAQTVVDHMPWLQRKERGQLRAWSATIWRSMFEPVRLARSIPADSPVLQAWWFAVVCHAIYLGVAFIPFAAIMLFSLAGAGVGPGGAAVVGAFAAMFLGAFFFWALFIPLWGATAHAILWATGNTALSTGASVRAVCYASGANASCMVPCIGIYLGWLWSPISATLMLKTTQQVHGFRAFLAAFVLPGILGGALAGLMAASMVGGTRTVYVSGAAAPPPANASSATQLAVSALFTHADANAGKPPAHAAELVRDNNLSAYSLSHSGDISAVRIGNTTMDRFLLMPKPQEDALVASAAAKLPPDTIAHRLGDLVFTYHGIDLAAADPGLWIVIAWPDPDNPRSPAAGLVTVGKADRQLSLATFSRAQFPAALAAQNALRASLGLPPLPDPGLVTTSLPALPAAGGP